VSNSTDHTINIKIKGDQTVNKGAEAVKNLDKSAEGANKSAGKLSKGFSGLTSVIGKGTLAFGAVAMAARAAVGAFAQLEAAQGRVSNAVTSAGGTQADYTAMLGLAEEASRKYGIRTLESLDALQRLTDASGDAKKAQSDYKLALDIAAQSNISLAQATEILAKTRQGDTRQLKEMRGVNKELATDLGKIEDETLRAELAVQLLTDSYEGSAEANAGLIDKQAAFKSSLVDLQAATGEMIVTLGTEGVGLVGAFFEMAGILEDGSKWLEMFSSGMVGFAKATGEAAGEVGKLVKGVRGLLSGKSVFEVISEADTQTAVKEAEKRVKIKEKEVEKKAKLEQSDTKKVIEETLKKQEADKRSIKARAKAREQAKKDAAALMRDEEREYKDWLKRREEGFKEADDRKFRDEMARLKMQGEIRQAMILEMERSGATAGEIELATTTFDADADKRLREIEQREEIARLTLAGRDAEAQRLAIMSNANLTPLEQELQLKDLDAQLDRDRIALQFEYANAMKAVAVGTLEALGMGDEAKRVSAGLDAIIMGYQAFQQAALFNWSGAAMLGIGTAQALSIAVGGGGAKTPSGGGKKPEPMTSASDAARMAPVTQSQPRETSMTVNVNTLSYVSPEDARRIAVSESREAQAIVGGRK
jgi:hypothetical protein